MSADEIVLGHGALGETEYHVLLQGEPDRWWLAVRTLPAQLLTVQLRTGRRVVHARTDDSGRCRLGPLSAAEADGPIELFAELRHASAYD
jgi:hypothetical protein